MHETKQHSRRQSWSKTLWRRAHSQGIRAWMLFLVVGMLVLFGTLLYLFAGGKGWSIPAPVHFDKPQF
jgi:hypothetical protein